MLILSTLVLSHFLTASALPEISISKRTNHGHSPSLGRRVGVSKRQDTVGTNLFEVLTWSIGGGYFANITAGTPPQPQIVLIDTGSSDLYFDTPTAQACETTGPDSCKGGTFDTQSSSTYRQVEAAPAFNTAFGDGSTASGPYGSDVIGVGDVQMDNVQFGVADNVTSTTGYAIGLMGIGYAENEATMDTYPNVPEVMVDAGLINSRLYSIYLNDAEDLSGTILFGGIDTTKYTGNLVTLDLLPDVNTGIVDQFVTVVTGASATVNGETQQFFSNGATGIEAYSGDSSLPVLLDTGSVAWSVPETFYSDSIAPLFSFVDSSGLCSCKYQYTGGSLSLEFDGQITIQIPSQEFIVPLYNTTTREPVPYSDGTDACLFLISPAQPTGQGFQTLGDAILRSMYLVYDLDNGQVSIAQSAVNSTASPNVVTVQAGPSGVAKAATNVVTAASNTFSVFAEETTMSGAFQASTVATTLGTATGTAAVPFDAEVQAGAGTMSAEMGWNSLWSMCIAGIMGLVGMFLIL